MAIEIVDFPIEHGDFPIENGDFPIENGDFPIENGVSFYSYVSHYQRVSLAQVSPCRCRSGQEIPGGFTRCNRL